MPELLRQLNQGNAGHHDWEGRTDAHYSFLWSSTTICLDEAESSEHSVRSLIGNAIVRRLTDDAPHMQSLHHMHELIAQSPRAHAKFFLLVDGTADVNFVGI